MKKRKKKLEINELKARVILETARRGLTLSKFAGMVSRSPQALNDLLKRNNPQLATIREFALALSMTMAEFTEAVSVVDFGEVLIPKIGGE